MFSKCLKEPLFNLENEFTKKAETATTIKDKEDKKKKKDEKKD